MPPTETVTPAEAHRPPLARGNTPKADVATVGDRIRARREELGISLTGLAGRTGTTKSHLWCVEASRTKSPSANRLAMIAAALDTTVDTLLGTPVATGDALTDAEKILLRKLAACPPHARRTINEIINLWTEA